MSIKVNSIKCPACGADLTYEEGRTQLFCSYCGTKVVITNENEYVYHHIDEAEMKQAETERMVQLKKMEMAEKKHEARERRKSVKTKISIVLGLVAMLSIGIGINFDEGGGLIIVGEIACFILLFMWIGDMNKTDENDEDEYSDTVKVPSDVSDFEEKNYTTIEAMFTSAGFTNVKCVPLNDLTLGLLKKPGTVESITIKGKTITSGGGKFTPDAPVVIAYHSYK